MYTERVAICASQNLVALQNLDGWLCFTSHRQRGHLETAPPFTVPCEGREARFLTVPTGNRTPGRRVTVHYTTAAPRQVLQN